MDGYPTEVVVMAAGLFRRPMPPEKICDEITTEHRLEHPPEDKLCFGVVCPSCERTIPMAITTSVGLTQHIRCLYCRWAFMLDIEAIEQVLEGETNE